MEEACDRPGRREERLFSKQPTKILRLELTLLTREKNEIRWRLRVGGV